MDDLSLEGSLNMGVQCECFITHALNSIFSENNNLEYGIREQFNNVSVTGIQR